MPDGTYRLLEGSAPRTGRGDRLVDHLAPHRWGASTAAGRVDNPADGGATTRGRLRGVREFLPSLRAVLLVLDDANITGLRTHNERWLTAVTTRLPLPPMVRCLPKLAIVRWRCGLSAKDATDTEADTMKTPLCPNCGRIGVPKLVIRGSAWTGTGRDPGVSLKCRSCGYEWSEHSSTISSS